MSDFKKLLSSDLIMEHCYANAPSRSYTSALDYDWVMDFWIARISLPNQVDF